MIRNAAVAGSFYPGEAGPLTQTVDALIAGAEPRPLPALRAVIAPHAGYVYSGPIAASVFAPLAAWRGRVKTIALFGPSHRVYVRGLALPNATHFRTPLGDISIDQPAAARATALKQVMHDDAPHAAEHSLEVELPFLQRLLGDFQLVPFAVGEASADEVAEVMALYDAAPETLIVVSSDLSHYLDYDSACATDRKTTEEILALAAAITHDQACGATPVNGLLTLAKQRGFKAQLLDLRNSGDTAGDKGRVVGYGGFWFTS